MADLLGVDLALGAVSACEQAVSAAVAAPVAEAHVYVQQQAVVHVDETGWRQGRQRAWLWVMGSAWATVFLIHARRSTAAARCLLGSSEALVVSDRWSAYTAWPIEHRQLCWAHLRREWTAFTERGGAGGGAGGAPPWRPRVLGPRGARGGPASGAGCGAGPRPRTPRPRRRVATWSNSRRRS